MAQHFKAVFDPKKALRDREPWFLSPVTCAGDKWVNDSSREAELCSSRGFAQYHGSLSRHADTPAQS